MHLRAALLVGQPYVSLLKKNLIPPTLVKMGPVCKCCKGLRVLLHPDCVAFGLTMLTYVFVYVPLARPQAPCQGTKYHRSRTVSSVCSSSDALPRRKIHCRRDGHALNTSGGGSGSVCKCRQGLRVLLCPAGVACGLTMLTYVSVYVPLARPPAPWQDTKYHRSRTGQVFFPVVVLTCSRNVAKGFSGFSLLD